MGNDNMVQNQKVFIRLEKVLELQRMLIEKKEEALTHGKIDSAEARIAMRTAWQQVETIQNVIAALELPITLLL